MYNIKIALSIINEYDRHLCAQESIKNTLTTLGASDLSPRQAISSNNPEQTEFSIMKNQKHLIYKTQNAENNCRLDQLCLWTPKAL